MNQIRINLTDPDLRAALEALETAESRFNLAEPEDFNIVYHELRAAEERVRAVIARKKPSMGKEKYRFSVLRAYCEGLQDGLKAR